MDIWIIYVFFFAIIKYLLLIKHINCYFLSHVVTYMFKPNSQSNVTSSQWRDFYMLVGEWQKQTTYSLPVKP